MTVPPGFTVEVVAAEPDIVNPVAMTFDERGRVWITESLEYPRRRAGPGRDRIKVLEDSDGDGRADRFTVFADGLNIPSGIAVGHGGVWVANSPDILFLQDRDGDGKADFREVVATGFGRHDTHELPNSLTWGPDGWLYGWNGVFNPGRVVSKNGKTYSFTCAIFRIHPDDPRLRDLVRGHEQPLGNRDRPRGLVLCERLRDRPSLASGRDRLLHPPGRAVSAVHLAHRVDRRPQAPEGGLLRHSLLRQRCLSRRSTGASSYMGNIHGNAINVDVLKRNGSTYQARAASPTFCGPTTRGSCRSSRRPAPTGRFTSWIGTTAITAIRTPIATPPASTG